MIDVQLFPVNWFERFYKMKLIHIKVHIVITTTYLSSFASMKLSSKDSVVKFCELESSFDFQYLCLFHPGTVSQNSGSAVYGPIQSKSVL